MPDNVLGIDWGAVRVVRQCETTLRARLPAILEDQRSVLFADGQAELPAPQSYWRSSLVPVDWNGGGGPGIGVFCTNTEWGYDDVQNEYFTKHSVTARIVFSEDDSKASDLSIHDEVMLTYGHVVCYVLQRYLPMDGADLIGLWDSTPVRTVPQTVPMEIDQGVWLRWVDVEVEVKQRTLMNQ